MKKNRQFLLYLIIFVILLEVSFVGCGGGGGGGGSNPTSSNNSSTQKLTYTDAYVLQDGSFIVKSDSDNSSINIKAERNCIANDSKITLVERKPNQNESNIFGNISTNIYKLVAVSEKGSGLFGSKTNIEKSNKPFKFQITQSFPKDITNFYLGTRSSSDADWQYSKLHQDGLNTYSNIKTNSISNSFRTVSVASVSYTFTIDSTTFGDEIAVFGEPVASSTLSGINRVTGMNFTTTLPYLDLKFNSDGNIVYNSDLVVHTAVEAERSGNIFSGSKVQTIITYLSSSNTPLENLKVVGKTTQNANQKVSAEGSGGGSQYTHSIYFDDYIVQPRSGNISTYSFTLKIREMLLSEFPAIFTIKTIFIDNTVPIAYATDSELEREMLLSYLAAISPTATSTERVGINTNLVMKYIAHDIASVSVKYKYSGLGNFVDMPGTFAKDEDSHLLTFTPEYPWAPFDNIIASVTAFCCDEHGQNGIRSTSFSFKTEAIGSESIIIGSTTYDPVMVTMIEPDPITEVATGSKIVLMFSDDIAWENSYKSLLALSSGSYPLEITTPVFDSTEKTISFKAKNGLKHNAVYSLTLDTLIDKINHKFVPLATFTFSTGDGISAQASITPTPASIVNGKLISKPVFIIDFGKDIAKSDYINENKISQAFNSIKVYKSRTLIPEKELIKNWITPYTKIKLTFNSPLDASSTYRIVMGNNVLDWENLPIEPFEPYIISTMPNVKTYLLSPSSPVDVPIDTDIVIRFSDQVNWKTAYNDYFYILKDKSKISIASYVYDSEYYTLTLIPKDPLTYNSSYTVCIVQEPQNDPSIQYIERNYFHFNTCDGDHINASIEIASGSLHKYKAICKTTLNIDFGESIASGNIAKAAIKLQKDGVVIPPLSTVVWSDSNKKLALTYNLEPETTYTVSMDSGVKTTEGKLINPFDDFIFETVDNITASVIIPEQDVNVATDTKIVFKFSDDIIWEDTNSYKSLFNLFLGLTNISSSIKKYEYSEASRTLTLTPNYLFCNASYSVSLVKGLGNKNTGQIVKPTSFSFKTIEGDQAWATATINASSLVGNRTILGPTITVDFTRPVMNYSAVNIGLYKGTTLMKNFTKKWSTDKSKVDLVFSSSPLNHDTEYTLKMLEFALDSDGVPIAPFDDLTFRTLGMITATLTTPEKTTDVASMTPIVISFSDAITWNQTRDADTIAFRMNGRDVAIKKYYYSTTNDSLTLTPTNPLNYNASFSLRINQWLQNDYTGQKVATATFDFSTSEGEHDKATVALDSNSVINSKAILNPTIIIDFKKDLISSDRQKAMEAVRIYKGNTEVKSIFKNWIKEYSKFKITFSTNLEHSTVYTVALEENGLKNANGVIIDPFDDFNFTTQDPIAITLTTPSKTTNVATTTAIVLTFSSPIEWLDSYKSKFSLNIGNSQLEIENCEFNSNNNTVTLTPKDPLLYNTTYTVSVRAGFKNTTTQQTTKAESFNFTTINGRALSATLIISENDKVDNQLIVTPTFIVDFGNDVLNTSTAANSVVLYKGNQQITNLTKTWISSSRKLQITCDTMLDPESQYKIYMTSDIKDNEGITIKRFDDYSFTTTPNGKGTETNPYLIYTASQLDSIRSNPNAFFRLMKDLNIATSSYKASNNSTINGWKPIGNVNNKFNGSFDGNWKTISGLTINRPTEDSVGLFGHIASATIKNLYIRDGSVIGADSCGGIVGYAYNSKITNCCNENVTVKGVSYVGGIGGDFYSTQANYLRNSSNVTSSGGIAGGVVGWNNQYSTLNACYNNGTVTNNKNHAGGITGYNNAAIKNCFNEGSISGYEYVGSIVGSNHSPATINMCIAVGNMSCLNTNDTNIGAIAGHLETATKITNCIITNNTVINSNACTNTSNLAFNFSDPTNQYRNYFYTNITTINDALFDETLWTNNTPWNNSIWRPNRNKLPSILDLP